MTIHSLNLQTKDWLKEHQHFEQALIAIANQLQLKGALWFDCYENGTNIGNYFAKNKQIKFVLSDRSTLTTCDQLSYFTSDHRDLLDPMMWKQILFLNQDQGGYEYDRTNRVISTNVTNFLPLIINLSLPINWALEDLDGEQIKQIKTMLFNLKTAILDQATWTNRDQIIKNWFDFDLLEDDVLNCLIAFDANGKWQDAQIQINQQQFKVVATEAKINQFCNQWKWNSKLAKRKTTLER